jgi:hypothetical protein
MGPVGRPGFATGTPRGRCSTPARISVSLILFGSTSVSPRARPRFVKSSPWQWGDARSTSRHESGLRWGLDTGSAGDTARSPFTMAHTCSRPCPRFVRTPSFPVCSRSSSAASSKVAQPARSTRPTRGPRRRQALRSVTFAMADGARAGTSAHQSLVFGQEPRVPARALRSEPRGSAPAGPAQTCRVDRSREGVILTCNSERSHWPFFATRRIVVRP